MNTIKIGLVSDLHAEFWRESHFDSIGGKVQEQLSSADVILLAGDIDVGTESIRTARRLFPDKPVCLVAGNHEFYGAQHPFIVATMRGVSDGTNVFYLHREAYVGNINGRAVRVLGVTLWTDFALHGTPDLSMIDATRRMNDFRLIRHGDDARLITPADTSFWHQEDRDWLLDELDKSFDGTTIILTHHAPVSFAISPQYVADRLSPCFASRLEHIFARDDVALVAWGHTHHSIDQTIGTTRFVSNQTGYPTNGSVETGQFGIVVEV